MQAIIITSSGECYPVVAVKYCKAGWHSAFAVLYLFTGDH